MRDLIIKVMTKIFKNFLWNYPKKTDSQKLEISLLINFYN